MVLLSALVMRLITLVIELSLTVPITNSLAFLFTVFGDWYVDRKVISRGKAFPSFRDSKNRLLISLFGVDTWIGMTLSLGGIALCVQSKR